MVRQGEEFLLTSEEMSDIRNFIRSSLEREWDHHTNRFICSEDEETGMKSMNPDMYEMAFNIGELLVGD